MNCDSGNDAVARHSIVIALSSCAGLANNATE